VPISPRLLLELREYWKQTRPSNYLFPGKTPDTPLSSSTIQKACKQAVLQAKILKTVTPHTLRHSYATGLLEAGVDLLTIGRLLGHRSFTTTLIYLHVRRPHLDRAPSPIDWLPIRQCPKWVQPEGDPDKQGPRQPTPKPPQNRPPRDSE
jgi:integrase